MNSATGARIVIPHRPDMRGRPSGQPAIRRRPSEARSRARSGTGTSARVRMRQQRAGQGVGLRQAEPESGKEFCPAFVGDMIRRQENRVILCSRMAKSRTAGRASLMPPRLPRGRNSRREHGRQSAGRLGKLDRIGQSVPDHVDHRSLRSRGSCRRRRSGGMRDRDAIEVLERRQPRCAERRRTSVVIAGRSRGRVRCASPCRHVLIDSHAVDVSYEGDSVSHGAARSRQPDRGSRKSADRAIDRVAGLSRRIVLLRVDRHAAGRRDELPLHAGRVLSSGRAGSDGSLRGGWPPSGLRIERG